MRTDFLCISVLRVASGHRVKLASCKSVLNTPGGFPLGVWEGLRFVIVALPGLFFYLFFILLTVLRRWTRC